MKLIQRSWAIVGEVRRAFIGLNLFYWGLMAVGMIYILFNPELQKTLWNAVGVGFSQGPLAPVMNAYQSGQVVTASIMTFVTNLLLGSVIQINLPSLLIPFSGLLMGAFRAVLWGFIFSPATSVVNVALIPHVGTIILEGEGYVLAMLAAYVQGKAFLWPRTVGVTSHRQGYVMGFKRSAQLYVLVILTLAVAAVYEAVDVIWIIPLFR